MNARDRDLLLLEPALFRDLAWIGQRLVRGLGTIAGTTLTLTSRDNALDDAGVGPGHVLSYDNVGLEIVERLGPDTATVSRPRDDPGAPPIPPAPSALALAVEIVTFGPQIAIVHAQVLRMLGIDPDHPGDGPAPDTITNPRALVLAESLGALHLLYAGAAAPQRRDGHLSERAEMYRRRYAQERARAVVRLDLDGDGRADATRRLSIAQLSR